MAKTDIHVANQTLLFEHTKHKEIEETAERLGITAEELIHRRIMLQKAWDMGGGASGARYRLKFAEDFLKKQNNKDGVI